MKILFVSPQIQPLVQNSSLQNQKTNFGGWTMTLINQITQMGIECAIVMPGTVDTISYERVDEIDLYIIPIVGKNKAVSMSDCKKVVKHCKPDLMQIEGTEFVIQNAFSLISEVKKIINLQGILSGYEPYQYGLIPQSEFSKSMVNRIANMVLQFRKKHYFDDRLPIEFRTMMNADYFTGRTSWDRAHSYWINPSAPYYPCNRILRNTFYEECWDIENSQRFRIYTSNGSSALKGLHVLLKAAFYLKTEFPDITLYVAGSSPDRRVSIRDPKTLGYPLYIRTLIRKLNLSNNVVFTGELDEHQVASQLKQANVYVLPSLIENSPNSLGEAMLMGVPCVSSYAGGVADIAPSNAIVTYRADDSALLAWEIKQIFESKEIQMSLSTKARIVASKMYDRRINAKQMVRIYQDILSQE